MTDQTQTNWHYFCLSASTKSVAQSAYLVIGDAVAVAYCTLPHFLSSSSPLLHANYWLLHCSRPIVTVPMVITIFIMLRIAVTVQCTRLTAYAKRQHKPTECLPINRPCTSAQRVAR